MLKDRPLTLREAASFTGLKPSYIYKLIHLGKIPCYRPNGGKVYFTSEDLEKFLYRGRRAADYELSEKADETLAGAK